MNFIWYFYNWTNRSSSTNSSQLKSEETKSSFIKNLTSKKDNSSPATHRIAKKLKKLDTKKNSSSSSTSPLSTKSSLSSSSNQSTNNLDGYYVTFEEFVNAADIVLEKRRKEKMQHLNSSQLRSQSYLDESQSAKSFSGDMNCDSYRNGKYL